MLREIVARMDGALVAFSGGVDSSLLLHVVVGVLGNRSAGFIGTSPSLPLEDLNSARSFARSIGVRLYEADPGEVEIPEYVANRGDRCYHCKNALFKKAWEIAASQGFSHVLEGTVLDELQGHRPGLQAVYEQKVQQPLVEAGFTKAMVRELARHLGIPHWDKPSSACLASRFPVGMKVDAERLGRVGRIEEGLHRLGIRQVRARLHQFDEQVSLRIELEAADLALAVRDEIRERIIAMARAEGFRWITLDLEGYRTGSVSRPVLQPETDPQKVRTASS